MIDRELLRRLPKAELHLHIEGTLEPERLFGLAEKHGVQLPHASTEALAAAYDFGDLQEFLDLYYAGCDVLRDEEDFYLMTRDYLEVCRAQNIVRVEIGFDPQSHTERGLPFSVPYEGIMRALREAEQEWGLSHGLMLNIVRHLPAASGLQVIDQAVDHGAEIMALGLDSSEAPFPPSLFTECYAKARSLGWKLVAHAGEEGPAGYVWSALNNLGVDRIDHGVRSAEDPELIRYLVDQQVPLTVCPQSNVRLCVYDHMREHNILEMLEQNVLVTVNSDDPAYFGGYLEENFVEMAEHLGMTNEQMVALVKNSFRGSFAAPEYVHSQLEAIDAVAAGS